MTNDRSSELSKSVEYLLSKSETNIIPVSLIREMPTVVLNGFQILCVEICRDHRNLFILQNTSVSGSRT